MSEEKAKWSMSEMFLRWCAENKQAADQMCNPTREPAEMFTVRLRPYSNTKDRSVMYLGWGAGLVDAQRMAMANARAGNHQILNWSMRSDNDRPSSAGRGDVLSDLPF